MDWLERPLAETAWVVLDTETTGLYPGLGHRVVEVAAVRWQNGRRVAEFQQLINPERPQDPQAARITGLADDELKDQPLFAAIYPQLAQFLDDAVLIAHNARFDADFLGLEMALCQPEPDQTAVWPAPWLCTLLVARRHFHFGRNHLAGVAQALGVPMRRAHRALNDVYVTAEIFKRMHKNLSSRYRLQTIGDWANLQGEDIFAPPLPIIELPEPLATAVANRQPVRLLVLTAEGLETVEGTPRYVSQHQGHSQLTLFVAADGRLQTYPLTAIFSAELLEPKH
jgi:DNA polymerase III subunit epsilon